MANPLFGENLALVDWPGRSSYMVLGAPAFDPFLYLAEIQGLGEWTNGYSESPLFGRHPFGGTWQGPRTWDNLSDPKRSIRWFPGQRPGTQLEVVGARSSYRQKLFGQETQNAGWLIGWLAGWLSGWLVGWLVGWRAKIEPNGWRSTASRCWRDQHDFNEFVDSALMEDHLASPISPAHVIVIWSVHHRRRSRISLFSNKWIGILAERLKRCLLWKRASGGCTRYWCSGLP